MAKLALFVLCTVLLATCVQGCFFLDIKCKVKEFIDKEGSQLIGEAKEAFEQAMDYLFDDDISPLIDKVQAAIDAGIDKIDKDVNDTINHIETSIQQIIHDAAQTANKLASNVTRDIEQIISTAISGIEQVEKQFYKDASNLLAQINLIVQKGQCMEASGAKQIQNALYKLVKSLLHPFYQFSHCWRSLGYKVTWSLEDLTDLQLYHLQKQCTLLNKITPNTPIKGPGGILETYAQGQLYAAEYFCIGETANAPAFQDVMTKEWLWWGVQYNAWNAVKKNFTQVEANQPSGMHQLGDDPCGTPVECYAKAIEALKEAEQKILSISTGLSNLNQTVKNVIGNLAQTNVNIQVLKMDVSANKYAIANNSDSISTNTEDIASNNNDINTNSNSLSSLSTYACNCGSVMSQGTMCPGNQVSAGFSYYCEDSWCKNSWTVVMDTSTGTGIYCCDLCVGSDEEAAAYALANPKPAAVSKECSKKSFPDLQDESVI